MRTLGKCRVRPGVLSFLLLEGRDMLDQWIAMERGRQRRLKRRLQPKLRLNPHQMNLLELHNTFLLPPSPVLHPLLLPLLLLPPRRQQGVEMFMKGMHSETLTNRFHLQVDLCDPLRLLGLSMGFCHSCIVWEVVGGLRRGLL